MLINLLKLNGTYLIGVAGHVENSKIHSRDLAEGWIFPGEHDALVHIISNPDLIIQ